MTLLRWANICIYDELVNGGTAGAVDGKVALARTIK